MAVEWQQAEPGVKRRIYPPGATLMMMEVHFEKGARGSEHSHPHEQFTYCLKGCFEFTIDGEKHIIKQGETLSIPSNKVHGALALEEGALLDCFTPLRDDLLNSY
ncbi:cupin domain-containing protein [Bacillus horti]|uniref:Quercetin dioxygenase-like cupin family protein n=1 Tax=Caldalkalibacillus horti TaxID=77523 RepID=A0ABT9VW24_9BACI|nr:quercetin dioxygenase-like cupin family protein [Bacillus horti]